MLRFSAVRFVAGTQAYSTIDGTCNGGGDGDEKKTEGAPLTGPEVREFYEKELPPCSFNGPPMPVRTQSKVGQPIAARIDPTVASSSSLRLSPKSLFLKSASEGNLPFVQDLLERRAVSVDDVDEFGWSALMCASYEGRLDVVQVLLSMGADAKLKTKNGKTAEDLASQRGHTAIVQCIQNAGLAQSDDEISVEECAEEEQFFCESCNRTFTDRKHETSTGHLLCTWKAKFKPCFSINASNIGYKLMVKSGWNESGGLGKFQGGRHYPIKTVLKRNRKGLGCADPTSKPRVTHFAPGDTSAVDNVTFKHLRTVPLRRGLDKAEKRSKRIARNFRRQFYE